MVDAVGKSFSVNGKTLLYIISLVGLILGFWYATSYQPQRVGIIFSILSLGTMLVLFLEDKIAAKFQQPYDGGAAPITASGVLGQLGLGIGIGVLVIYLNTQTGFSIGLPSVQQSLAGGAFTSIIGAPLIEEPFFGFVVPFLLFMIFSKVTGNRVAGAGISLIVSGVVFALYHWAAYGADFTLAAGAFLGAGIFCILLRLVLLVRNGGVFSSKGTAMVIVTAMVTHAMFNAFIYTKPLFTAGGVS